MSYDTNNTWVYQISGRNVHLYQYMSAANSSVLAGYRIALPHSYYGNELVYPNENITNGLRYEGTAFIELFVNNDPNELSGNDNPTLTNQSSPDEEDHINLSRMLCLAVVDYIKAQIAEASGNVELKEYFMKSFWKKVGDQQSNKSKTSISYTSSIYGIK